jgi:hypothetical protein
MSTTSSHVAGGQVPPPGLDAVLNDSARLVEALAGARRTRRLLLLGVLAFVAVTGLMFYRLISRIRSQENIDEVTRLAQARLAENSDQYMNEVRLLVDKSTPVLTDAFYKQAKNDLPALVRGVGEQQTTLVNNLLAKLEDRMSEHYRSVLDRHEAILQEELPETKDPELRRKLGTNLGVAFDRLVKKYYADEINKQVTTLVDAWERFPEASQSRDDPPLGDQLVGNMFELLKLKMIEGEVGIVPVGSEPSAAPVVPGTAARDRKAADPATGPIPAADARPDEAKGEAPKADDGPDEKADEKP